MDAEKRCKNTENVPSYFRKLQRVRGTFALLLYFARLLLKNLHHCLSVSQNRSLVLDNLSDPRTDNTPLSCERYVNSSNLYSIAKTRETQMNIPPDRQPIRQPRDEQDYKIDHPRIGRTTTGRTTTGRTTTGRTISEDKYNNTDNYRTENHRKTTTGRTTTGKTTQGQTTTGRTNTRRTTTGRTRG